MPGCVAMTVSLFSRPYFGNRLERESSVLPDEVKSLKSHQILQFCLGDTSYW